MGSIYVTPPTTRHSRWHGPLTFRRRGVSSTRQCWPFSPPVLFRWRGGPSGPVMSRSRQLVARLRQVVLGHPASQGMPSPSVRQAVSCRRALPPSAVRRPPSAVRRPILGPLAVVRQRPVGAALFGHRFVVDRVLCHRRAPAMPPRLRCQSARSTKRWAARFMYRGTVRTTRNHENPKRTRV